LSWRETDLTEAGAYAGTAADTGRVAGVPVKPDGANLGLLTDPVQLLVTAAQPANVDTVIVDGRVPQRGGELTTPDEARVRAGAAGWPQAPPPPPGPRQCATG